MRKHKRVTEFRGTHSIDEIAALNVYWLELSGLDCDSLCAFAKTSAGVEHSEWTTFHDYILRV